MFRPEKHYTEQFVIQGFPFGALKIQRINVLILFRGIFGVFNGAVGPVPEPFGIFLDIRMVRRTLEGDVHGNVDGLFLRRRYEMVKVGHCAKVGMNRLVAAFFGADGPRAAGVVRARFQSVVGAFAVAVPDRMDRRQVQHVEPHAGDVG